MFWYIHEIAAAAAGAVLFALGFMKLREKWLIDNTPTSKIRSVAMGLCEVKGRAVKKFELLSRLTFAPCVYFKFLIEKEVRNSKGGTYWQAVDRGESTNYFYVEDETGRLLVDPLGAETVMEPDYRVTELRGNGKYRYTEWYISPGDATYVLGTVRKFNDNIADRKEKLAARLRELKQDKQKMAQFDLDKDGAISPEEWDKAVEQVNGELLREEMAAPAGDDIVIAKSDAERVFLLSDESETRISRGLLFTSAAFVIIGVVLMAGMAVSALAGAGVLPPVLRVPWQIFYR